MKSGQTFIERLADVLHKDKAITADTAAELKRDFKDQSKSAVESFLFDEGLVDKEALLSAYSHYYQVPAFDVMGYFFDHALVHQFPKDFLLRNLIIPLEVLAGDNILVVVASDPHDETLLPKLGSFVSYDIQFNVGIADDIIEAIDEFYDESLQVTDDNQYIDNEEMEEERALDIERRRIDRSLE